MFIGSKVSIIICESWNINYTFSLHCSTRKLESPHPVQSDGTHSDNNFGIAATPPAYAMILFSLIFLLVLSIFDVNLYAGLA